MMALWQKERVKKLCRSNVLDDGKHLPHVQYAQNVVAQSGQCHHFCTNHNSHLRMHKTERGNGGQQQVV